MADAEQGGIGEPPTAENGAEVRLQMPLPKKNGTWTGAGVFVSALQAAIATGRHVFRGPGVYGRGTTAARFADNAVC